MRYSEKWGDSIDAAVNLALQDLKLTRDQVNVTVLEQPSRGFFGIGSKLAKVRVEEIVKEEPKALKKEKVEQPRENKQFTKAEKPEKTDIKKKSEKNNRQEKELPKEPEKQVQPAAETKPETETQEAKPEKKNNRRNKRNSDKKKKEAAPAKEFVIEGEVEQISVRPENLVLQENHPAKEFLEKILKEMELEISVKVSSNEDSVYVDLDGKDTGMVIGKRGQTLDAVQYLTSLVVNRGEDEYIRVVVDAEGYRGKREETLEKLAYRLAEKAVETGRSIRLEPMNPYERKVIHTTLQTVPAVRTRSEGNEPFRKVVIEPSKGRKKEFKGRRPQDAELAPEVQEAAEQ